MRKVRLELERLDVQSYSTAAGKDATDGTVYGNATLLVNGCSGYATCASACSETNGVNICKSCGPCCF